MKKILFRADAKPSIGIGDLMSLITLGEYLSEFDCFFLTQKTAAAKGIVEQRKPKNVFWLNEDAGVEEDVTAINMLIDEYGIDMLFFEITERKLTEYIGLNNNISTLCVNFDGFIPESIKLVINWDVDAYKYYDINKLPDTKFLLGPKYVILPKSFYSDDIKNRKYSPTRKKILIAMGGADEFDFTSKVAHAIGCAGRELVVIVGAGYEKKAKLEDDLNKRGIKYEIKVNINDMLSEYLACDFAIGAGGLTSSELVASKTPCALIATYEHQVARCKYFENEGAAKYLGFRSFNDEELNVLINEFCPNFDNGIFNTMDLVDVLCKI